MSAERKSTSSISRRSQDHSLVWPGKRHWLVGAIVSGVLALIYAWVFVLGATAGPELRIAATEEALSTLVVDGEHRILILNANGPQDARAVLGTLSRPWEARPTTLVVSATRGNVEAVWESLMRLEPRQLIVAGAPGADPDWATIDRHCREEGIDVSYLEFETGIALETLKLTIVPPGQAGPSADASYVSIKTGSILIALDMSGTPAHERQHLLVTDSGKPGAGWSDVRVATDDQAQAGTGRTIALSPGERIDVILGSDQIHIQGSPAE